MKTIALFDNCRYGHHTTYIRIFSKTLLEMGYRVMAFCRDVDDVDNWISKQYSKYTHNFFIIQVQEVFTPRFPLVGKLPNTFKVLAEWRYAAQAIREASSRLDCTPDLVFFAWLDSYLNSYLTHHIIDSIFPYPWSGLYVNPPYLQFGHSTLPILNIPLTPYAVTQSTQCRGIALLDEVEAKQLQYQLDKPVVPFPDFTDDALPSIKYELVHQIKAKAGDRKIIGLLGGLTRRKGLFTLLKTSQQINNDQWFFIFVGQLYIKDLCPEEISLVQSFTQSNPKNCFFHLERIPDEAHFNAVINACDVLFAAYEHFPHSSNILTKAAIFEKPVIVSDRFLMHERVKAFQLGISIPEASVNHCINALNELHNHLTLSNLPFNPVFESYRKIHSTQQLHTAFHEIFRHALN